MVKDFTDKVLKKYRKFDKAADRDQLSLSIFIIILLWVIFYVISPNDRTDRFMQSAFAAIITVCVLYLSFRLGLKAQHEARKKEIKEATEKLECEPKSVKQKQLKIKNGSKYPIRECRAYIVADIQKKCFVLDDDVKNAAFVNGDIEENSNSDETIKLNEKLPWALIQAEPKHPVSININPGEEQDLLFYKEQNKKIEEKRPEKIKEQNKKIEEKSPEKIIEIPSEEGYRGNKNAYNKNSRARCLLNKEETYKIKIRITSSDTTPRDFGLTIKDGKLEREGNQMMEIEILRDKKAEIEQTAARHGAYQVRIFGSAAQGEERPDSDIDLLVTTGEKTSPWFPGGLIADLEELLGRRVEIVTEKGLNPLLRDRIFKEAIPL